MSDPSPAAAKAKRSSPKTPGRRELRRYLDGLSKDELIEQLTRLFADFAPVRELYQARLSAGDDTATRDKYKRIIDREFRLYGNPRVSAARKAVLDYQKVAGSVEGVADLMIHYVERGIAFAASCGYDVPSFYTSMETMWGDAMLHIKKHDLQDRFEKRCLRVLAAANHCGYGVEDVLTGEFFEVFVDPEDE